MSKTLPLTAATAANCGHPYRMAATAMHANLQQQQPSAGNQTGAISLSKLGIKLVVCDMAGTTVEEHGLVYKVLRESMVHHGLPVSAAEMHPWHGEC